MGSDKIAKVIRFECKRDQKLPGSLPGFMIGITLHVGNVCRYIVLCIADVAPGSLVVTNKSFNAFLKESHEVVSAP